MQTDTKQSHLEIWAKSEISNSNNNNCLLNSQHNLSEKEIQTFEDLKNKYPSSLASCLTRLMLFFKKYPHPSPIIQSNTIKTINHKFEYAINDKSKQIPRQFFHKRKVYILPHGGMGDHITMIAAIRVYSVLYDEVVVGVRNKYASNVSQIFSDDPTIKIHSFVWPDSKDTCDPVPFLNTFRAQGYEILVPSVCCWGGQVGGKKATSGQIFYRSFYEQCDLSYDLCRWQFSHINRDPVIEDKIFNQLQLNDIKYAFVHGDAFVERVASSQTNLIIVKPVGNMIDLCKIIEHATEIYVMDSSFFCLCVILKLKAIKKNVYVRHNVNVQAYKDPIRGYYNTSIDHWNVIGMESIEPNPKKSRPRVNRKRITSSFLQGIVKTKKTNSQLNNQSFRSVSRLSSTNRLTVRRRVDPHRLKTRTSFNRSKSITSITGSTKRQVSPFALSPSNFKHTRNNRVLKKITRPKYLTKRVVKKQNMKRKK
jgi:hypothetical protein